jgi:hypothetical protein
VKFGIIMDVEASRAIREAAVGAAKIMIELTAALRHQARAARRRYSLRVGGQPRLGRQRQEYRLRISP